MTIKSSNSNQGRRSPVLAFILGMVPGLGQIYAGHVWRGLGVFFFAVSTIGLTLWRLSVHGVNYIGPITQAPSAEEVRGAWGMALVLFVIFALVYLWSIWDGVRSAQGHPLPITRLLLLATLSYFIIGWDVTEIDVPKAITGLPKLVSQMEQILWPWPDAIQYGLIYTQASAEVDVPCGDTPPETPSEVANSPYIAVTPTCGDMEGIVQTDGTRKPAGTLLRVVGKNFRPNELATAWWKPPDVDEFRRFVGGQIIAVDADSTGAFTLDFPIPNWSLGHEPIPNTLTRSAVIMRQERNSSELVLTEDFKLAVSKIVETIFLAMMATLLGMVLALPLSFLAARNLMSGSRLSRTVYQVVRTIFNIVRSIEPLVLAAIFIGWVSLGPFAGTLALAFHTVATLGKLYSEAIESIEPGPLEAIQATGANWLQVIIYGIVPQIIPPFVSFRRLLVRWAAVALAPF